jgi:hypothetical protein
LDFWAAGRIAEEGRFFFLKKRSKKLLQIASGLQLNPATRRSAETDKSFLLLFFKKEVLPAFSNLLK